MIFSCSSLLVRTFFSQHQRAVAVFGAKYEIESCDTLMAVTAASATLKVLTEGKIGVTYLVESYSSTMHVFVEIVYRDAGCEISAGKDCTRMSYKLTVVDRICQFFFFAGC